MTDKERDEKFLADFARLQRNREAVPLERLQNGKMAKKYGELVQAVQEGADWFARYYLNMCLGQFPFSPEDEEGKTEAREKVKAIIAEENKPGGLRDKWRAALIDRLDMDEYNQTVWERYDRIAREALFPYWSRHCRQVKNWIYNDILKKWWLPKREGGTPGDGTGCWINRDYTGHYYRYPPTLEKEWGELRRPRRRQTGSLSPKGLNHTLGGTHDGKDNERRPGDPL